jgi:hypothetical protein
MKNKILAAAVLVSSLPVFLFADAISPSSVTAAVDVGSSITINKTVTIAAGTPTTSKVDVLFLADVTGSMSGEISAIQGSANAILSSTAGVGNVAFGVASYRDFNWDDAGTTSEWPGSFTMGTTITTSTAAAQTAIGGWAANYGYDTPEAQLYALDHVATDAGWRAGSARIVVWFGDAPGHDPAGPDAVHAVTEAQATAALVANHIKVEALDVGYPGYGLDQTGQATRITAATGGTLYSGINNSSIVAAIQNAITLSFATYNSVSLDASGAPSGVNVVVSPAITGAFDRSVDRTFNFTETITGTTAGVYDFDVNALVGTGIVATERNDITVKKTTSVPEPNSLWLLSLGFFTLLGVGIRRKK